jgi:hypothetical protein
VPSRDARAAVGEILEEPIVLSKGETLQDRTFRLSGQFRNARSEAIIRVEADGVRIRNVRIIGPEQWDPRWDDWSRSAQSRRGLWGRTPGIRIQHVRDVSLEQIEIEGLPQAAILGFGIEGGHFRDIRIHHCYHGINFIPKAPSRGIHIEQVHVGDLWGPGPEVGHRRGKAGNASRKRTGGWIGGDAMALNSLRDALVEDCTAMGEMFGGFKMTNPQKLEVRAVRAPGIQIKGTAGFGDGWEIHKSPARDVWIHDCVFDKGLADGAPVMNGNCVQVSQHVASILIERCVLDSGGKNGHGIQFSRDVHGRVVDCTIRGFNGRRGSNPAYAIDVALGSTVNEDFAQVNHFVDQERIMLVRNPSPGKPASR